MSLTSGVMDLLPDGNTVRLYAYHVCLEGLESKILFRDDEDYEVCVKMIFVCAHRTGVQIVIYSVVSNHTHECLLAKCYEDAVAFGEKLKIAYGKYVRNKYGDEGVLRRVSSTAITIDSDRYLRNVLAYIPRNALDNGARNIADYKWTGYRAMFCGGKVKDAATYVKDLSTRERERIMHTGDKLKDVTWILNSSGELEPASCCNWRFLERVFFNDQAFFLRILGGVNTSEMRETLVDTPRMMMNDNEFLKTATEICQNWFGKNPGELTLDKKARIIPLIRRKVKTTVSQLSRIFELSREKTEEIINPH